MERNSRGYLVSFCWGSTANPAVQVAQDQSIDVVHKLGIVQDPYGGSKW